MTDYEDDELIEKELKEIEGYKSIACKSGDAVQATQLVTRS